MVTCEDNCFTFCNTRNFPTMVDLIHNGPIESYNTSKFELLLKIDYKVENIISN